MDKYSIIKTIETVLYVLEKTEGIDYYRLFKILYFAEKEHLVKWGDKIIADDFCALPYGPVPTKLFDAIKGKTNTLSEPLWKVVEFAKDDAPTVLLPKRPANMDYISASEKEVLDRSINDYAKELFNVIKNKSHDEAWQHAFSGKGLKVMNPIDIAKAGGANSDMIEYISDQISLDAALL